MGNKRLPDNLHVLRGTFKPCRHGDKNADPLLPAVTLDPPEWLPEDPATEWRRIVTVLEPAKVLTEGDMAVLLAYCLLYGDLKMLGSQGSPIPPPMAAQLRLCAAELGLTPSSRAKLGSTSAKKANEFEGFTKPQRKGAPVR